MVLGVKLGDGEIQCRLGNGVGGLEAGVDLHGEVYVTQGGRDGDDFLQVALLDERGEEAHQVDIAEDVDPDGVEDEFVVFEPISVTKYRS